jgi:hypothetical protein
LSTESLGPQIPKQLFTGQHPPTSGVYKDTTSQSSSAGAALQSLGSGRPRMRKTQ